MSYYLLNLLAEIFYALTGALIVFLAMELLVPGMVLAHINYNFVLLLWLINGIVILIRSKSKDESKDEGKNI